jgi:hypothetical protein
MSVDPAFDLEYLQHALEELERYLLSNELFWPVLARPTSGGSFLKLTLGNLLLSRHRLETLHAGRKLSRREETELRNIQDQIEVIRRKWSVAWEEKAGREFRSRFGQWGHVLSDLKKDFEKQAPYYHTEVRLRVLLELLSEYAPEQDGYDLAPLDAFLRGLLTPARFIWPLELERGFPREEYWFLYGDLRDLD